MTAKTINCLYDLQPPEVRDERHVHSILLSFPAQGKYAEAEALYLRSLKIQEGILGPDHPDVATSLNDLAGLLELQV